MESHKTRTLHCKCCLTKHDLIVVSAEKQQIISSLLNVPQKKLDDYKICINCNSSLSCIDKFRQNSKRAHTILEKCKLKNTFLSSVTDESVNSAFDTILNWMNDVTVILKYYLTDFKEEETTEVEKESETESLHGYEDYDMVHEENLFVGSVEDDTIKQEQVDIEVYAEVDKIDESENSDDDDRDYIPEVKTKKEEPDDHVDKKYTCYLCGKKYAIRKDLVYHMNVHSGTHPYKCEIDDCTKAYPHPRTLKIHQREVHNIWNGEKVEPPPVNDDPEYLQKLEGLTDEYFQVENFYVEDRKGNKRPYQCNICSRYYNKTEFQYHRNIHLGLKPFSCEYCDKNFTNPFELGKHYRKTHAPDKSEDEKGGSDTENDKSLIQHTDDSLQNTGDDTNNYRSLEKYFVDERRGCRRAYQCPDCKKVYSRGELKYHLNTHKNIKPYSCAIEDCTKTFCSPRDMRVHAKKYHKVKVKPVKDYSMKRTRNVYKPKNASHKADGEEYNKINVICTVCGKSVRKKHFREHYQTHIKPDFACPFKNQGCTDVFKNKMKLTSHIQAQHDPDYVPTTVVSCMCELCGKQLTKTQLKYHMNLHLGITPYACEYPDCSESYRSPNLLRQHIAGYHLKQMRFKCHYCSKRFNTREEQDQHKTEDCGVKTATCHLCGRTMNKFSLKNHLLIHTGEKSWVCEYEGCGKAFLRRDKLQQHKKVHSTEDHYTCPFCNSGFKYKSWLDTHIEKKHVGTTEVVTNTDTVIKVYQMIDN